MKNNRLIIAGVVGQLLLYVASFPAFADNKVSFSGSVMDEPPCIFNEGAPVVVDFGTTVITTRIDGVIYSKEVAYNLVCTSPPSNTLRLQVKGTASSFDSNKLATDKPDLAIAITADSKELPVNQWLNFTNPARPLLKVVPVKKTDAVLKGGVFSATGTIMVDYQ